MVKKLIILFGILSFIFGCSSINDSDQDDQFISLSLSGSNYKKTLRIDNSIRSGAMYVTDSQVYPFTDSLAYTLLSLFNSEDAEPHYISITFPGKEEGLYEWSRSISSLLLIQLAEDFGNNFFNLQGSTEVTKYGSIGKKIEGNISGTLLEISTQDTINVIGEFSLIRGNDFTP